MLSHIKDYLVSFAKTIGFLNKTNHCYKKHQNTYTILKFLTPVIRQLYENNKNTNIKLKFSNAIHQKTYLSLVALSLSLHIYI